MVIKKPKLKFLSGEELVNLITSEHKSISRFGEGELKLANGFSLNNYQIENEKLQKLLNKILNKKNNNLIICLLKPIIDQKGLIFTIKNYWKYFVVNNNKVINCVDRDYLYGNTNITRPYMDYKSTIINQLNTSLI